MDDKYEKYQFTYEERKEILNCVKNYVNLTKEERCRRRLEDFECSPDDENRGWFRRWFSKDKIFPFLNIKVESWPDQLNDIDLRKIEQIYLDKNYYHLLPFKSSRTYTDEVMSKFLKNESTELVEPLKPDDTIIEVIDKNSSKRNSDIQTSSNGGEVLNKSTRKKSNNKESSNEELIDNQIYREELANKERPINKEKCPNQSLLKQRLIKKRVWLNEQGVLIEQLNEDVNANYLNNSNELDNFDDDQNESYEEDQNNLINENLLLKSSNLSKKIKSTKKVTYKKPRSKVTSKVKKSTKVNAINLSEFSDYEQEIDQENNTDQTLSKELILDSTKNSKHQIYLLFVSICLSIFVFKFANSFQI